MKKRTPCALYGVVFLCALGIVALVGPSAFAEDETIILGQEDAATGNLSKDLKTAAKLIKAGYDAGQLSRDKFIQYGNWYGPGWWGGSAGGTSPGNKQPIDELDAIAQRHDFAYQIAEEQGKIHGPAEEARLKAMADSIAVRDANALPRNPLEWDPPAPDPEQAHEYRRRIGFGFQYESGYYRVKSALTSLRDTWRSGKTPTTSGFSEADIDRMAQDRAKTWFSGAGVRRLYRAELTPSSDLLEDIGSIEIQVRLYPVVHEGSPHPGGSGRVAEADPNAAPPTVPTLTLTASGYGELSRTTVVPDATVTLTATKRWGGLLSTNGYTVTVTAEHDGSLGNVDVVKASTTVTIARRTFLEISASPNLINEWDPQVDNPHVEVTVTAHLTTRDDTPIEGMPLNFVRDYTSELVETDSSGTASRVYQIFKAEVQGEMQKLIPISVTTAASEIGGTIYLPSTRTTNIELRGEESKVVVGRVVDRMHNDAPIGGASVSITDPSGETRSMTTEADGRFRLTIPIGNDSYPTLQGSASANGFEPGSFSATTDGKSYIVRLTPLEATLVGHIINEETGIGIDGSTVHVTAPFDQVLTTSGGDFTLTGLYVGETITMRADAQNFRAYVKSGKLTLANASVTFSLKPSDVEGSEEGGGLDAEEADEEDKKQVADLSKLYSLMVWATPADPGTFQDVTITAQIFPPTQGVVIEVQMHGTDDYAASNTGTTNAMGKVFLSIPGAASGIVDDVVAWIVGTSVKQRLRYSF